MPQAVQKYIDTHSFEDTDRVKRQILTLYRNSIYDYAGNYAEKVVSIFDQIHAADLKIENGIEYLPLYMVPLL